MRSTDAGRKAALVAIAAGSSDIGGAKNAGEAYRHVVRLARRALGLCEECREILSTCSDCQRLHPGRCCGSADCPCPCEMEDSRLSAA